jgi:exosome complex RNA-binding protein Csl4
MGVSQTHDVAGEAVMIESADGPLHITHNGIVVATNARRHLIDDDDRMARRAKRTRPALPTKGGEVLRIVDRSGASASPVSSTK